MEDLLRKKIVDLELVYVEMPEESIQKIYQLFCQDIIGEPTTSIEFLYFCSYYHYAKTNMELAEPYYLQAIKQGNIDALINLIVYHQEAGNTVRAKEILSESIKYCTEENYRKIGNLYKLVKDYDQMKQYYLSAIASGDGKAMNYLGLYYQEVERNRPLAKKYYRQAIKHKNGNAAYNLACYYYNVKGKHQLAVLYIKKRVKLGDNRGIRDLADHYLGKRQKKKYLLFGLKYRHLKLIERHYQHENLPYLIQGDRTCLGSYLLRIRHGYIRDLFVYYKEQDTWFKHYCVKDVIGMIQDYVIQ